MDPELERARHWYGELIAALAPADGPLTPAEMREAYDRACDAMPIPPDVEITPADADGIPGMWLAPAGVTGGPTILYLHPGGYAVGSVRGHRHVAAAYAKAAGARVLAIDYRLAPEHPYPAAVEDAVAAFRHLGAAGHPADQLAIVGESAGGGLALATLLALRDAGEPLPGCAVAVSPWTDLALTGESMRTRATIDPVNSAEMLGGLAMMYLAGADSKAPLASPLYGDPSGLPPLLIMVGSDEVLLDDATRFAARATGAGTPTELYVGADMVHIWTFFESFLPPARDAISRAGRFVEEHCIRQSSGAALI
jgi:epsilon-lactone hydrolase